MTHLSARETSLMPERLAANQATKMWTHCRAGVAAVIAALRQALCRDIDRALELDRRQCQIMHDVMRHEMRRRF